jgi:hypothetical protein
MSQGYEAIKARAKQCGVRVADLLILAEKNDPFYAGSPVQRAKAAWFADLWARFGYTTGVHLRRVHYRIVSGDVRERTHDGIAVAGAMVRFRPALPARPEADTEPVDEETWRFDGQRDSLTQLSIYKARTHGQAADELTACVGGHDGRSV